MSYPTDRIILFDRDMNPLPELAVSEVFSRERTEEINGEHALVIVTTRRLQEGWRLLTVDATGKWYEWVVAEPDEEHSSGKNALGTYHCVWSLQYDLTYSYFHDTEEGVSIGMGLDTMPEEAAEHVLAGVVGWSVGACDAPIIEAGTGCVFIRESAWSKLSKLVEHTACEVDVEIEVSNLYGVTARKLCLKEHVGNKEALRRFDWGYDLTSVKRTPDPGPYYCRIVPLGKGESEYADDDETTYDYPIDITEETGTKDEPGPYWIQDDEAAEAFRIKKPDGSYYYPTKVVTYSEDDPELLYNMAVAELYEHTRPGVTYEADVVQLAEAGMDVQGVAIGDEVQVVDYGFNPDAALRIQGRVIKIEVDELAPQTNTQLTIGQLRDSLTKTIGYSLLDPKSAINKTSEYVSGMSTSRYLKDLLDRLNEELNATGGYSYIVAGEGVITYDVAVTNPLIGTEATKVVQVKGGAIRIADSKKDAFAGIDDWEWKTVFTSGHIAADLVTASNIVSGWMGSADAYGNYTGHGNYINFDTGETHLGSQFSPHNLVRNGAFALGTLYWAAPSTLTMAGEDDDVYAHCLKVTQTTDGTSARCFYPNQTTNFRHTSGKEYTLTFRAKADVAGTITVCVGTSTDNAYFVDAEVGTEWELYTATVTANSTGALNFWFKTARTLYITNVMLVEGNSSYGFSENPKDMDQEGVLQRLTGGYANEGLYIEDGHLYINASFIATGELSGFKITSNAIYTGTSTSSTSTSSVTLASSDFTRTINGNTLNNLRFAIAGNFGVTSTGVLYAANADISGKITATSGKIGGFTITSTSIYNSKLTLYDNGMRVKYGSNETNVGLIGANGLHTDSTKFGLNFDLEYSGAYMTWAVGASSSASTYDMKLTYANKTLPVIGSSSWTAGRLHVACDVDMHNYEFYNWSFYNAPTVSRFYFALPAGMASDGTASSWWDSCYMEVTAGVITELYIG